MLRTVCIQVYGDNAHGPYWLTIFSQEVVRWNQAWYKRFLLFIKKVIIYYAILYFRSVFNCTMIKGTLQMYISFWRVLSERCIATDV